MSRRSDRKDRNDDIREMLDKIETEMRHIGMWDIPDPGPDARMKGGAFGMKTMAFEQWLRWVFVPNVKALLSKGGPWPTSSDVGVVAIKNFDGQAVASDLVTLLCEFDLLFKKGN